MSCMQQKLHELMISRTEKEESDFSLLIHTQHIHYIPSVIQIVEFSPPKSVFKKT